MRWQLFSLTALVAVALTVALASQCGPRQPSHLGVMCEPCERSDECQPGLGCVNGTCETAPPSCHVKIGL